MKPEFFPTPARFRKWLETHHRKKTELLVGFYKKASGRRSITWPESVDQALCFGWIDGIRRSRDDESYTIRFTPRTKRSHWSAVNINRFAQLKQQGLVREAGFEAYAKMDRKNSQRASFEQETVALDAPFQASIKKNPKAWAFFQSLAPSYRKSSIWWVMSAKREETKWRRLSTLIESSAAGEKIPPLRVSRKK